MTYPTVRAKIIKMEDGSGYEGKVYDQYVFIELSDGKIIGLFDPDMTASPDLLNKVKDITIDVIFANVEKLPETKYDVEPALVEEGKYHKTGFGHIFSGRIQEKNDESHRLFVDIGIGIIMVAPGQDKYKAFQVGEFVKVFTSRTDLFRVYD
jgi:hypothetical protein